MIGGVWIARSSGAGRSPARDNAGASACPNLRSERFIFRYARPNAPRIGNLQLLVLPADPKRSEELPVARRHGAPHTPKTLLP